MHLQFNPAEGMAVSEALEQHARECLDKVQRRFGERVTRVEIHLKDVNGPKGGMDKECLMEARPAGLQPVVASAVADDTYQVIKQSADKLEKVLESRIRKADAAGG